MAERGRETLRHGPMKPFGLTNPHAPQVKAYAIVQLRQDNKLGTLFNMVGFQTKLRHGEQTRIFRTIPGLEKAEFARLGGLHRNTYLNSPQLLDETLRLKSEPRLRFAGQITGCEGYVESAAIGLMAGRFAAAERLGEPLPAAAADHGAWRPARPHHRRPRRDHRCRPALLSADEREFRLVPAADAGASTTARTANACAAPQRRWRRNARSAAVRLDDLAQWVDGAQHRGRCRITSRRQCAADCAPRATTAIAAATAAADAARTDRPHCAPAA